MTKEDVCEPVEGDVAPAWAPSHQRPIIHQVASAPMPSDCEFSFFDPSEPQCRDVLLDPNTTIPELFAVLRQWVPQVQKNIGLIGNEILKRGCGVNDRDGLTDMSLLHYCCKAGAPGIGDAETAASFARQILSLGADPNLRSRWTNMRALHYAAYFDVPQLIRVVLQASQPGEVDATCSDFDFGTSLHIAASNLCISAVKCLLELGANPAFRNEKGQCPADVVPDPLDMPLEMADAAAVAKELRTLLRQALPRPSSPLPLTLQAQTIPALSDKARIQLATMGIRLGDRVVIAGQKVGTLRFCGSTEFSGGLWAGVELDKPEGKNDGSVAGVQYFTCRMKHGIFAPLSKISKPLERHKTSITKAPVRPSRRIDLSRITSKINTGLSPSVDKPLDNHKRLPGPSEGSVRDASVTKTGVLSRSLSSSSSSLDSRPAPGSRPRPLPRQHPSARQRRERVSPSPKTIPSQGLQSSPDTTALTNAGVRSRTPSASSSVCGGPEVHVGERVLVVGQRTGVVQFYGKTSFAPGLWLGIKLDKPSGKNDGSVGGVRYFSCPPKHGVFAPPSRVQRIHGSVDCLSELSSSRLSHPFSGTIRRSFSTSSAIANPKESNRRSPVSRSRSNPHRRRWNTLSGGVGGVPRNTAGSSTSPGCDGQVCLRIGMQVLLNSANEMAFIRYLGTADFAPGIWLGLELRSPKGKNDGSVGGRRYFSCRAGHGVLVRPSRVTYRGINGSRLVNENS
ncbi:CAP-Gly domain-containing linker protein 4-like isoform X2 [Cheilinus undulatus]|nr:CAP-Gly domain-containing linker protein 4-like isoform X2 [Cheilinus undulatus]XP_041668572.1 CAP-Gly domain-containing linker protein 4-like isoform X2 [Cheilinus undulatus]XP_041668573.1 CAP-Gly domain-containing linker protein 4-like isoform X2 [Cheilinus undulatus]XP_041668574.1 CAP-Gly domain-containing linker protein 4-like isoform X2 [Cheilinus undulatus]